VTVDRIAAMHSAPVTSAMHDRALEWECDAEWKTSEGPATKRDAEMVISVARATKPVLAISVAPAINKDAGTVINVDRASRPDPAINATLAGLGTIVIAVISAAETTNMTVAISADLALRADALSIAHIAGSRAVLVIRASFIDLSSGRARRRTKRRGKAQDLMARAIFRASRDPAEGRVLSGVKVSHRWGRDSSVQELVDSRVITAGNTGVGRDRPWVGIGLSSRGEMRSLRNSRLAREQSFLAAPGIARLPAPMVQVARMDASGNGMERAATTAFVRQ
jgi:hypothetical protein